MLRFKPIASAARAVDYFAKTDGGYYHGEAGLRFEWGGKAASKLGLFGEPDQKQFARLMNGLDPNTGEQLTAKLISNRIPAWDVTASVPKGVTTVLEMGDDRVHDAIWRSFRGAMASLEEFATTRVRSGGEYDDRVTGNLVWYAVEHAETRPVEDPNMPKDHPWRIMPDWDRHIHGVVANVTYDEIEDKWKAAKFRPIMDRRKFFDRVFDSLLADEMASLGYEVETKWKNDGTAGAKYYSWDIKGIPEDVIERFSRRSGEVDRTEAEILEAMREKSGDSAPDRLSTVARDQLGATSRRTKRDDLTLDECREYWNSRIEPDEGEAIAETIRRARAMENVRPERTAETAVTFAIDHHFERESCVRLESLMTTALERTLGTASPQEVGDALKKRGLILAKSDGDTLVTTPAIQKEEAAMAAFAANGRGSVAPIGLSGDLERGHLNDGQWQAVTGLLQSSNRVNLIEGPAGAGKSSMLRKFDDGAKLADEEVTYLGTTSSAVKVLRHDGFDAHTLARFLVDEKMQEQARDSRVVIDEASMLGHADAVKLIDAAERLNLKLIVMGDPQQHGSVGRGAFMRLLKSYGHVRPFRLTEILRQQDDDYRLAAKALSEGKPSEGFEILDRKGWVHEITDDAERLKMMADDYLRSVDQYASLKPHERALIVSPTHAEGAAITAYLRDALRAKGQLGTDERQFVRLVSVNATEAERGVAETYQPGDVIQFHQNAKGFEKGDRLKIRDITQVPLDQAARFSVYRPESIALASGDVIRFTATVKSADGKHVLRNGDFHTVTGFDARGDIRLENGWTVAKDAGHYRHGFVETSFGSQGRTVRHVILGMSSMSQGATNAEQMYVSATRARQKVSLFTDDKATVRDAIRDSSQKKLALDLMSPQVGKLQSEDSQRRRRDIAERDTNRRNQRLDERRWRLGDRLRAVWERPVAAIRNRYSRQNDRTDPDLKRWLKENTFVDRLNRTREERDGYGR